MARTLRVTFVWTRDRFAHTIAVVDGTRLIPLFASADCCDTATDWPPSPPFQQLSIESNENASPIAFLVGMAGRSHWSASIEPVKNEATFLFDIAVRVAALPTFAGSGYRTMVDANLRDTNKAEIKVDGVCCEIIMSQESQTTIEKVSDGVSLRCLESPSRYPATLRWKYKIQIVE